MSKRHTDSADQSKNIFSNVFNDRSGQNIPSKAFNWHMFWFLSFLINFRSWTRVSTTGSRWARSAALPELADDWTTSKLGQISWLQASKAPFNRHLERYGIIQRWERDANLRRRLYKETQEKPAVNVAGRQFKLTRNSKSSWREGRKKFKSISRNNFPIVNMNSASLSPLKNLLT